MNNQERRLAKLEGITSPADQSESVIIYDPEKGQPEIPDHPARKHGTALFFLPDNGRDAAPQPHPINPPQT